MGWSGGKFVSGARVFRLGELMCGSPERFTRCEERRVMGKQKMQDEAEERKGEASQASATQGDEE